MDLEQLRVHLSRSASNGVLAVTELLSDVATDGPSNTVTYDDAILVVWQIANSEHEMWFDKKPISSPKFSSGQTSFYDLRRDPSVFIKRPYHSLHFYMPYKAINQFAEVHSGKVVSDLEYQLGHAVDDPVIHLLGNTVRNASGISRPENSLFLEHMLNALCAHVAFKYGKVIVKCGPGTLSARHEARAKELMGENLGGTVSLQAMADACGMSLGHFSKAFRGSTGQSPHKWITRQRIEKAKALIASGDMNLAQIAIFCGFSDQAHFTRVFAQYTGATPSVFRSSLL